MKSYIPPQTPKEKEANTQTGKSSRKTRTANLPKHQGPVVQSIVSLTSSLRGQLVKYFMTL